MIKMNKYFFLALIMVNILPMYVYGQKSCKDDFQTAESYYNKKKYNEAKKFYQSVINCGDEYLAGLSKTRIKFIDDLEKKPVSHSFGLSSNKVTIPYQGGDAVVTVNGNASWRISIDSEWCSIRKSGSQIIISSKENKTLVSRSAKILVVSGTKNRTIEVINEGAPEMLRSSVASVMFPSKGETNSIDIYANTSWKIKDVPQWINVKEENNRLMLTASVNDEHVVRKANIKIESSVHSVILINVFQSAGKEKLSFSKNKIHFGSQGGDEYIRVYTDAEDWRFGDFPHWCQLTRIGQDSIKIHCTPNAPINEIREASINVTTGSQTLGINVSQEAKPLILQFPQLSIGGRAVSLGIHAGYVLPMISASSSNSYTGSVVNYAMGNETEEVLYSSSGGFTIGAFADIRIKRNLYLIAGLNYTYYGYKNEYESNAVRKIIAPSPDYYFKGKIQDRYTEKYSFSSIEVPILASYRFPVTPISHVQVNLGPVLNYGLSAKMKLDGNSDGEKLTAYKRKDQVFTDIIEGSVIPLPHHIKSEAEFDLYDKKVKYSEIYVEQNNAVNDKSQYFDASPLKRLNMGARLGVVYEYKGFNLGLEYNYMFTNMANKRYWEGKRWNLFDQFDYETMTGYKQYNHTLQVKLGYTFRY